MSEDAFLPCFVCGSTLKNAFPDLENQPLDGTEFRTYGHYGSSFWDSMHGEELVLNICDACLRDHPERLAQHKRYRPVVSDRVGMVGKHYVNRPMVPYTGHCDDGDVKIEPEEIGSDLPQVEWPENAAAIREWAIAIEERGGGV